MMRVIAALIVADYLPLLRVEDFPDFDYSTVLYPLEVKGGDAPEQPMKIKS